MTGQWEITAGDLTGGMAAPEIVVTNTSPTGNEVVVEVTLRYDASYRHLLELSEFTADVSGFQTNDDGRRGKGPSPGPWQAAQGPHLHSS